MEKVEEVFGENSNIVFAMWNTKGIQAEVYCPQPSFSRTKPLLPLLRVLGDKCEEVSPLSYSVDFDFILEEALEVVKKRGYEGMEKNFNAWITEWFAMSKCFDVSNGENIDMKEFLETEEDKRAFKAWLTFFFILSRYILKKGVSIVKKERTDYFTHLSFEDFKDVFMKFLEELESEKIQDQQRDS